MFEVQNYDVILRRILKRFPENEDIRPSSPLYIATGPAAKEFETVYGELDYTLTQIFPTTSNREYLIKDASTYNMAPFSATKSVVEGEFDVEVDIGTRFTKDGVGFVVTEKEDKASIEYYYYSLECEEAGEIGNVLSGVVIPDWNIPGLKHAYITRILVPGEDEEDTEAFRTRFLASFNSKSFGGNLSDYMEKVTSINGVGRVKVLRCRDFELNVKPEWVSIIFTDAMNKKPTEELVALVQEELQPLGVEGLPELETSGLGLAPIGHLVFVKGAEEEEIDIGLKLTYAPEYSWDVLHEEIEEKLANYLDDVAGTWGEISANNDARYPYNSHLSIVRARIESLLLDMEGILDANETMICGEFENYDLDWDTIPVLGRVYEHNETDIRANVMSEINICPYNCPDCSYNRDISLCPRALEALDG